MMCGSLSRLTGSEACSTQASVLTVTRSGILERRWGLKAYPYEEARSLLAGGLQPACRISSGVTVASASAGMARECGARCGHFTSAYAIACWYQGHGHRPRRCLPPRAHRSPGANAIPRRAARPSSAR